MTISQLGNVVAMGQFSSHHAAGLRHAAEQADLELSLVDGLGASFVGRPPLALLVDPRTTDLQNTTIAARAESGFADVAVMALAPELTDLAFAEAYSYGIDDVLAVDATHALTARLRMLVREPVSQRVADRGVALVVDEERARRVMLAHALRAAGYEVRFAADIDEARRQAEALAVVVLSDAHHTLLPELIQARDQPPITLLLSPPRLLGQRRQAYEQFPGVVVSDAFAPAEYVLFQINEILGRRGSEQRRSARVLYGAMVGFRPCGHSRDEYGYSFNISEQGLYVRTLMPPAEDSVWLELSPPRSQRRVRLTARVAWRSSFGSRRTSSVPPGFGAQIVDGARDELEAWQSGYRQFLSDLG